MCSICKQDVTSKEKALRTRRRCVVWERRDARISNYRDGSVAFEQRDVEFPVTWSFNATNIVAQKYFRGQMGSPARERSVKQMIGRVASTIATWGRKGGYFASDEDAEKTIVGIISAGVKGIKQQAIAAHDAKTGETSGGHDADDSDDDK